MLNVMVGATVINRRYATPIGSKFSTPQMITICLDYPQQFQFEFFPAQYGFFHQYFVDRAGGKAGIQGTHPVLPW